MSRTVEEEETVRAVGVGGLVLMDRSQWGHERQSELDNI